jgi:cytochrome P450
VSITSVNSAAYTYALSRIVKAVTPDLSSDELFQASRNSIDFESLINKVIDRIRADRLALSDQKLAADLAEAKLDDATKDLEEARAEIKAMVEDRRSEEERARMRLLEFVLRAEVTGAKVALSNLLPQYTAMLVGAPAPGAGLMDVRAALLADLDALVALGLRGEVAP